MRLLGTISYVWKFLRDFAILIILLGIFASTVLEVYVFGVGATPQLPPEGYELQELEAKLQWHRGNKEGAFTLQVAVDDPTFSELLLERQVSGTTHFMRDLEPGRTYYWRLLRDDEVSATRTFKTSAYAIDF
jgi:hypothetical protein